MKNILKINKIVLTIILTLGFVLLINNPHYCANEDMQAAVNNWLGGGASGLTVERYRYKANGKEEFRYAVKIPDPPAGSNIVRTPQGEYYYLQKDGSGAVTASIKINLTAKFTYNGQSWTGNGIVFTNQNADMLVLQSVKLVNTNPAMVTYQGCPDENGVSESTFLSGLDVKITASGGGITPVVGTLGLSGNPHKNGEDLWTRLKEIIAAFFEWLKDIVAEIINNILIGIANGIRNCINAAVGSDVTIGRIVYGTSQKFTIDYWHIPAKTPDNAGDEIFTSVTAVMKDAVAYWYTSFRSIAVACYLILLIYVGLRMILATNANRLEDIKERLNVWLSGVVILFFFPYVMRYMVEINQAVVTQIHNKSKEIRQGISTVQMEDEENDMMEKIRSVCLTGGEDGVKSIPLTLIYIIMLGELILLIIAYYKRAFMIGFLITFFPIVCIKHLFDGIHSQGKGHALGAWTKEFSVLVFTQLVHAVIYSVLIEGAGEAFVFSDDGGGGNLILYALFVSFLFKAEGIAKSIFQVESKNGLLFDMAAGGAAAYSFGRQAIGGFKSMVSKEDSKHDKEDKESEKKYTQGRRQLEESRGATKMKEETNRMESSSRETRDGARDDRRAADNADSPILNPQNLGGAPVDGGAGAGAGAGADAGEGASDGGAAGGDYNEAEEIEKAKTVIAEKAMKARNGSYDFKRQKGAKNFVNNLGKNAGRFALKSIRGVAGFSVKATAFGVGLASGAAAGNLTAGLRNGLALSKTAGLATAAAGRGADWAGRKFKAQHVKKQVQKQGSQMEQDLRDAGVNVDALFNNQKGEMIRKALAAYASGMVRGGQTLADKGFTHEILSQNLDKTEENSSERK